MDASESGSADSVAECDGYPPCCVDELAVNSRVLCLWRDAAHPAHITAVSGIAGQLVFTVHYQVRLSFKHDFDCEGGEPWNYDIF